MSLIQYSLIDPKGLGHLFLLMHHAHVEKKYEHIFIKLKPTDIAIDCGGHTGAFTDIIVHKNATVHTFEPNPELFNMLSDKYQNNKNVHLYNQAVWDRDGEMPFYSEGNEDENFYYSTQGANICNEREYNNKKQKTIVKVIDLTKFIKEILGKHSHIKVLKIDIEGAEFELIEKIIKEELYKNISYIFCETHERHIPDGSKKMSYIKKLIKDNQINNIYLDWV